MKNTLIGIVSTAALGAALLTATTSAWADPAYGQDSGYSQDTGYADNGNSGPASYNNADNMGGGYADNGDWGPRGYPASGNAGPGPYSADNAGPGTGKVVADTGWDAGAGYQNGYANSGAGYANNGDWGDRGYPASGNAGPGPYSADNAGPGTGKVVADTGWNAGAGYQNGYADNAGWNAGAGSQQGYADNGNWSDRGYPASGNAGPGPYSADNAGPGTGKVVEANGWNPVSYGAAYGPDAAPAGSPTAAGVCNMMPRRTAQGVRSVEVCE